MAESLKYLLENISEEELNPIDIMFELSPIMVPIMEDRFVFKHPGFREEREWRLYKKQVGNFDEDTGEEDQFFNGAFHVDNDIFGCFSCSDLKFRSLQNNTCSYYV